MTDLDIVVHVDDTSQARTRLAVTAQLGESLGARVAAASQIEFAAASQWAGFDQVAEWRRLGALRQFGAHARHADLAVVGQPESGGPDHVSEFIMTSGRPILAVPQYGAFSRIGETVMIAWNGSREASRAVFDSLPLLRRAKRVIIAALDGDSSADGLGEVAGADIARVLARRGVAIEVMHSTAGDLDVGNALLSRLAEIGADLLVMGAYSRHPLRERTMGGATHHILRHMTVPVFFSH